MTVSCFQCGLPVPENNSFEITWDGKSHPFCCVGCQSVAQLIHGSGLDNYYQFREKISSEELSKQLQQTVVTASQQDLSVFDLPELQKDFVRQLPNGNFQATLYIENMHCAACAWLIEQFLAEHENVVSVSVNSATHRCLLEWKAPQKLSVLMQAFRQLGYAPKPASQNDPFAIAREENKKALMRLAIAGFAMVQVGMFAVALYAGAMQDMSPDWRWLLRWVSAAVATPVVFFSAKPFFINAWAAISTRHLTMDVPVALAIGLAYLASLWATVTNSGEVYFDSVSMFTFFLLLGRYLEMRIRHANQRQVDQLRYLLPPFVKRVDHLDKKTITVIPLQQLRVGDYLQVNEGEMIAVDGRVIDGNSHVNEAMLTGEATPIEKSKGSLVAAGTQNIDGTLMLVVEATGNNTRLSGIEQLMEQALHNKPKQIIRADKLAGYFVSAVLIVASIVFMVWFFVDRPRALWVTLSLLVVTCPCALSLATPVSLTATIYRLRQLGLLVAKPHVIDGLSSVDTAVFDKTGTLTTGNLELQKTLNLDNLTEKPGVEPAENVDEPKVLATYSIIAAALESGSTHPIAHAFNAITESLPIVTEKKFIAGKGVQGVIEGARYRLGKLDFVQQGIEQGGGGDDKCTSTSTSTSTSCGKSEFTTNKSLLKSIPEPSTLNQSASLAYLGNQQRLLCLFIIADSIKPEAHQLINDLKDKNVNTILLSGDQELAVKFVADELCMDAYQANQSPENKLAAIKSLQQQGKKVLMVGDGLNDLPVLSGADVSVAVKSASDMAQLHADSVLLHNDLSIVEKALRCAKYCQKIIQQNLTWAIVYNLIAFPLAVLGLVPPWAAAIGMSLSSLVVVLNASRIMRFDLKEGSLR